MRQTVLAERRMPPQRFEGFAHVGGGDALQVEPGDEAVDRGGAAQIGRQDLGPKLHAVVGVLAGAVADSWLLDLQCSCTGKNGAFEEMAVAHDATAASFIVQVLELGEDVGYFEFKGPLEELSRTVTDEFVKR
jgi:hypothetical protein